MIEIKPDPAHPGGGYALVEVDGATSDEGAISLTIFNSYTEQYLGEGGWQPNKVLFGPYPCRQSGETLGFVVGPEIVNFITDDTPVRIGIGEGTFDTYWPDDVNSNPQAPVDNGKIGNRPQKVAPTPAPPVVPIQDPEPPVSNAGGADGGEGPALDDGGLKGSVATGGAMPDTPAEPDGDAPKKSSILPLVLGGVVLLAIAGAAWFFLQGQDEVTPVVEEVTEEEVIVAEPETASPCGAEALASVAQTGFAGLLGQLSECGAEVSADEALLLVEDGVEQEDPDALSFFGALYDETVTEETIEGAMGLTFPDNAARAAGYYSRAVAAGSSEAEARLSAICRRLLLMSDTLSQGAHDDYCN